MVENPTKDGEEVIAAPVINSSLDAARRRTENSPFQKFLKEKNATNRSNSKINSEPKWNGETLADINS